MNRILVRIEGCITGDEGYNEGFRNKTKVPKMLPKSWTGFGSIEDEEVGHCQKTPRWQGVGMAISSLNLGTT